MKVKDIIKLIEDGTEVLLFEQEGCYVCTCGSGGCWGEIEPSECPEAHYDRTPHDFFHGRANHVPIKLSERNIKSVSIARRPTNRKKEQAWFIGIRMKPKADEA